VGSSVQDGRPGCRVSANRRFVGSVVVPGAPFSGRRDEICPGAAVRWTAWPGRTQVRSLSNAGAFARESIGNESDQADQAISTG
jgi:hypothetical protein